MVTTEPAIVSHPEILLGKPIIEGTRISVQLILERLAAGNSVEQIHRAYPHLPEGSVVAAIRYAAIESGKAA